MESHGTENTLKVIVALGLAAGALVFAVGTYLSTRAELQDLKGGQMAIARDLATLARRSETVVVASSKPAARVAPASVAPGVPQNHEPHGQPLGTSARRVGDSRPPGGVEGIVERYDRLTDRGRERAVADLAVLARWGNREAVDTLLDTLKDPNPKVREEAIDQLGKLADPSLVDQLAPLLDDPDPKVREELAKSLEDLPTKQSGEMLRHLLRDEDREVVERALKGIGDMGYQDARGSVAELLNADDPRIVGLAGRTLSELGDERGADQAVFRLSDAYGDPDPDRRRRVIEDAGKIGGAPALALLENALDDADPKVRKEAEKGLKRLLEN